jgi:DNA-binding transcriptional ArsR family regulator
MGLSKTEIFSERINRLSAFAKALSHPARLAILEHLFKQETCVCGDLVDEIGLAQPTISQHLKELKNLGLIKGTIQGTRVCYCLDVQQWEELGTEFNSFLDQKLPVAADCC